MGVSLRMGITGSRARFYERVGARSRVGDKEGMEWEMDAIAAMCSAHPGRASAI